MRVTEDLGADGFVHRVVAGIPPVGDDPHRYRFRLLVLDAPLGLAEGVTAGELRTAADGHTMATGTLVGRFGR